MGIAQRARAILPRAMELKTVFLLQHVHVSDDGSEEDVKLIGVYRSRDLPEGAIERLRGQPGFVDHPDGFEIGEYELDKDHWTEGFVSWAEAAR